jgi:hypothetical protein
LAYEKRWALLAASAGHDAQALHRMIAVFQREEIRLQGMVNDVAEGRIVQIDAVPG